LFPECDAVSIVMLTFVLTFPADVLQRVAIPAERLPRHKGVLGFPIRDFGHGIACKRFGSGGQADGGVMM
jgi:hypothetical protein